MTRLTQTEFARLVGVNKSTVNRWLKAGRIEADAAGRIDAEAAQRMRLATESPLPHHQARKAQFEAGRGMGSAQGESGAHAATGGNTAGSGGGGGSVEKIGQALRLETYKLQRAKAELANLEVDQKAGALIARSDVDFVVEDFGAIVRSTLEAIPARCAGDLAAASGDSNAVHKVLEDAMRDALADIGGRIASQMERICREAV